MLMQNREWVKASEKRDRERDTYNSTE